MNRVRGRVRRSGDRFFAEPLQRIIIGGQVPARLFPDMGF